MQGGFILPLGQFGAGDVITVGLVDNDGVSNLENTLFDPLQFIAGTGNLQDQEEIDHGGHGGFGLANADGFNNDHIKPGGLADEHGFPRLPGNTAQTAA